MSKKIIAGVLLIILIVILTVVSVGVIVSQRLSVTRNNYAIDKIIQKPITILQISDLHYPKNGITLQKILEEVASTNPDIVVMTGDIIDGSALPSDIENLESFFTTIAKVPCFSVIGNHEIGSGHLNSLINLQKQCNITVLNNEARVITVNDTKLTIIGLQDASKLTPHSIVNIQLITDLYPKILLAHRCEMFAQYADSEPLIRPDIVFAGHAHGGQVRLFGRGLYSPNQGSFPKYSSGKYTRNNVTMFVNRGLGDSVSDFRMFNSYELTVVTISK